MVSTFRVPSKGELEAMRQRYKAGSRVRLVKMNDPQAPPPGTMGTCQGVDDAGNIMVAWDTGSHLNVAYREDSCAPV